MSNFNWTNTATTVLSQGASFALKALGYETVGTIVTGFITAVGPNAGKDIAKQLDAIRAQLTQIQLTLDAMSLDLQLIKSELAVVNMNVTLSNVKLWAAQIEGLWARMNAIMTTAKEGDPNVTTDITDLIKDIKSQAYTAAFGIYSAMVVPDALSQTTLSYAHTAIRSKHYDALDFYGLMKSLSTRYLDSIAKAKLLLTFAAERLNDNADRKLVADFDTWITKWDLYLEFGTDSTVLDSMHSAWSRALLKGAQNGTKSPKIQCMRWMSNKERLIAIGSGPAPHRVMNLIPNKHVVDAMNSNPGFSLFSLERVDQANALYVFHSVTADGQGNVRDASPIQCAGFEWMLWNQCVKCKVMVDAVSGNRFIISTTNWSGGKERLAKEGNVADLTAEERPDTGFDGQAKFQFRMIPMDWPGH